MRPRYITATRVAMCSTAARLWLISMQVSPSSEPELRAQILHQVQDLRLRGHVQGRGRLVANDHFRAVDQGPGDRDPLPEPAGELVRILPQPPLGPRHAHLLEQPHRPGAGLRRARPPVPALRFDELVADRVGRVQRGHRFLEDHAHPVLPDVRHLAFRQVEEVPAVEREPPGRALRPCGQQVHERERGQRLAAPRFADDCEGAPPLHPEPDLLQRVEHPGRYRNVDAEALDLEDGRRCHAPAPAPGPDRTAAAATRRPGR